MPPKAAPSTQEAAQASATPSEASALQTTNASLEVPASTAVWSRWYVEAEDKFADFNSFEPSKAEGTGAVRARTLSARQISGQFDVEVAKSWEEDWEDEDLEDTFDHVMGQMASAQASAAAAN